MTSWHFRRGVTASVVHGGTGKADHAKLYNSRKWRAYSKAFRAQNPLCVRCQTAGRLTPSAVTDHVTSHGGDLELFWDPENHQPLCKRCHDVKSAKEDGGGWRNFGRDSRSK